MTMIIDGSAGVTFPNSTIQASAGSVIQVVNATYSTLVSTSTNTLIDTGLTATITPKFSTSKILVLVDLAGCGKDTSTTYIRAALLKNSSILAYLDSVAGYTGTTATNYIGSCGMNYLDNPATTSATTYKIQFSSGANAAAVYVQALSGGIQATSTITLMEIAG